MPTTPAKIIDTHRSIIQCEKKCSCVGRARGGSGRSGDHHRPIQWKNNRHDRCLMHHSESWSSIWCSFSRAVTLLRVCNCNGYYQRRRRRRQSGKRRWLRWHRAWVCRYERAKERKKKNHEPQQSVEFPLFTHREYWSFCHLLTSALLPFSPVAVCLSCFSFFRFTLTTIC